MNCKQLILIWLILLVLTENRTDLSKNECPNMFLLATANSTNVTKAQINSIAAQFYSVYDNDYLQQSVQAIVIQGDPQALSSFISNRMTIYIIILSVFIIIFSTSAVCCIFNRSCPPSALRRDLNKRPYTICQFRIITALTFLFTVGVIVPGFVAFSYIPELKKNMELTKCSIYIVLDAVLNGEKDTGWGGFNNLYGKIQNVTQYLTESLPSMSLYLSGDEWLLEQMNKMKQMNLDIYSHNKDAKLITPNPSTTKTAIDNGFGYPTIESRFISKGMGPNGTANTMVTDIDRGLRTTQKLSSLAYEIEVGAKRVLDSSSTLLTNTNSSLSTLSMYISQLTAMISTMHEFKSSLFDSMLHYGLDVMEASFGLLIIGGFCCLMGVVATYRYEAFRCRSMVNVGWALFGFGFMGSVVVVFVTLGLGSLGYGFCNYFDSMVTSQPQFNKLGASYSQNAFTKLDSCFFGDGNVLSKFNLGSQMGTITKLFEMIQTYYDYENELSTNYIDKNISISKISTWIGTIDNYKKGVYVDYNESVTTDDNPFYAIDKLNLYTKGGAGVPTCAKDRWVFDKTNCTQLNETVYAASDASNGLALETTNASICVSFNERFSNLMTTAWTPSDLTRRYTQTRGSCPNAYDKILEYAYTIIRFRDSRVDLFQGINDELTQILSTNLAFNTNLSAFKEKLLGFQYAVSDLNNVVSNSLDGLMVSSDCRYIVNTMRFTYNMFCINVMYDVVKIGWCAIVVAVLSAVGMVFLYVYAGWFADVERHEKWFTQENYDASDFVEVDEVSSVEVLKEKTISKEDEKVKGEDVYDIGKDFEKLGQFAGYVGKTRKETEKDVGKANSKMNKNQQNNKIIEKIDSDDSSEEENPYIKQLKE